MPHEHAVANAPPVGGEVVPRSDDSAAFAQDLSGLSKLTAGRHEAIRLALSEALLVDPGDWLESVHVRG